jgi:two-component system chemotaxis response regulator CheY
MALAGVRILVVDDDQAVHRLLEELLRFWGCEAVALADNGREGVEKYEAFRPHVVLMDMDMPVMNGYEASRAIMELDPKAGIVILTGMPQSRLAARTLEQGLARVVIPKPFRFDQLEMAIQEALRKRGEAVGAGIRQGAVAS